jgi:two-component system sensor histidine kinase PilS (NtrC family)
MPYGVIALLAFACLIFSWLNPFDPKSIMPKNIREWLSWLIKLRIVVVTTLLGVSVGVESLVANEEALTNLSHIILFTYFLSLIHYLLLRFSQRYVAQAYFQTSSDLLVAFSIIYVTGGIDSYFSFLYLLSVIMSSILLYRRGAFLTASASSILMVAQYSLTQLGILPLTGYALTDPRTAKIIIGTNVFAFFAVAYLSSHVSESLKKTGTELEDKRGKLANLQAFNENIINSMRGGLFTTNLDGSITLFNRSACEITGFNAESVIGVHVSKVFNFCEGEGQPVLSDHLPCRFEKSIRNVGGEEIYLGFTVSRLLVERNQHVGYVYTFQDLTEIKKLEAQIQQKDRMAAIGRMAAGIAHEIRNPLTAISGCFHLLKAELTLSDDQRKLIENISLETKRLYRITTDFLLYAKPIKFSPCFVDLNRLTKDAVNLLKNSPHVSPTHRIEGIFDPNNSLYCVADPDLIKQVFWNLCNNAVKAMPEGGSLSITLGSTRQGTVEICFQDTGIGLTEEEQKKIFEPFQSMFSGGTGLGLSLVSQIIEAHQGSINVTSSKGEGTIFKIDLPRHPDVPEFWPLPQGKEPKPFLQ